ncbi:cadherin domain-containing protein [Microvirga guangxiensis]|uniref:Ca2+-binding protein, RTX toxin-related n=1 Tax=Microvirga guangxiensis TaxID=549386 RepID=A0A1G5KX79_9HYPH|nr:cadherin domain-containing protein [Microvirga guangxiensis]SCZ04728.1 Ca2+-binding protein, RTX toxin-related [Microvirga guangxiensis]
MSNLVLWGPERILNKPNGYFYGEERIQVQSYSDGSFVAVWQSNGSDRDGAGNSSAIIGRVFNADGTPRSEEFIVNSTVAGQQSRPVLTILKDGRFAVAWEDQSRTDGETDRGIRARIFNKDGTPHDKDGDGVGDPDFLVNTVKTNEQINPSITALSDGGFVIAYESNFGGTNVVQLQAYDAFGEKVGGEILANASSSIPYRVPVVQGLSGNRFVVLSTGPGVGDDIGSMGTIRGRIMTPGSADGGSEFIVPSSRGTKMDVAVTELSDGKFIVAWTHYPGDGGNGASDGSGTSVKAQIFNADGTMYRGEFIVNDPVSNDQKLPSITALPGGGFAIAYIDVSTGGNLIRVAIFDKEGGRSQEEIVVGPPPGVTVSTKAVLTTLADGRILVAWDDIGTTRVDDQRSVRGQIIDPRSAAVNLAGTAGSDEFYGTVYNDMLGGGEGADNLTGDLGSDTLMGGKGADVLNGGRSGVAAGADGVDFASYANAETGVTASLLANGSNTGDAAGDIYISIEGLIGSAHADRLSGDNNANTLMGGGGNDVMFGNDGADLLEGGEGDDELDGGAGADILKGGAGNDTYHVDNASDKVEEASGEGEDTVIASVSYALNAEAEIEVLRAQAGTANINLTGSGIGNKIYGNDGANELNGGAGADTLEGGLGDDVYVLDNAGDIVTEGSGELSGYDTVVIASNFAGGTYRVADYANIEALRALDGAGKVDLIGSDIANKLTGNAFDNVLEGRGGNDEIDGGGGVNTAVFTGAKADYTITRNTGNGTYTVTVADNVQGRDGTDLLKNIRFLQFSDGILDLEQAVPALSISPTDAAKSEGHEGTTDYVFTVTRDTTSGRSTVDWTLSGLGGLGAASLDDFDGPTSGSLTFEDGQREKTIIVKVKGDKIVEGEETFNVNLSNGGNATITTGTAKGVIINDDAVPMLSISATDAAKVEGDTGYTEFTFTISRSSGEAASSVRWTVVGTGDNPASLAEFDVLTDVVSFAKDETTKTIRIRVKADKEIEGDETFSVVLSDPTDATIGVGVGSATGTIIDDDVLNLAPTNIRLATGEATASESMNPGQVVARVMADDDGLDADLRYSIAENPYFVIDEKSGDITVKSGMRLNYENGNDGAYTVTVTVRDLKGAGLAATRSIVINIDDVDEAATGINFTGAQVVKANATLKGANVVLATADDPDTKQEYRDNLYRFANGSTTDGIFTIDAVTGQITTNRAVTSADVGDHLITVVTYDGLGRNKATSHTVTVVAADNQVPTITEVVAAGKGEADAGAFVIYENEGAGAVADVNASDNDGDTLTYQLINMAGLPAGVFSIDANTGVISMTDPAALNLNADTDYVLTVQVSDNKGGVVTQDVTIRVKNAVAPPNAAPTGLSLSNAFVLEYTAPGTEIGTLSAVDGNGDPLTYTLLDNAGGRFAIVGNKLMLAGSGVNFEEAKSHQIKVQVSDGKGGVLEQVFTVNVGDETSLRLNGTSKNNKLNGGAQDDVLNGKKGNDTVKGLAGDDLLYGDAGNDKLYGGLGLDTLSGGKGNDKLYGEDGNDVLNGNEGHDQLWGGAGADVFVFDKKTSKASNFDQIKDFRSGEDKIYLDNKIFKKLGTTGTFDAPVQLDASMFKTGKARDKNDFLVYKKGILYYDANGSKAGGEVEIVKVKGLKATDIFII